MRSGRGKRTGFEDIGKHSYSMFSGWIVLIFCISTVHPPWEWPTRLEMSALILSMSNTSLYMRYTRIASTYSALSIICFPFLSTVLSLCSPMPTMPLWLLGSGWSYYVVLRYLVWFCFSSRLYSIFHLTYSQCYISPSFSLVASLRWSTDIDWTCTDFSSTATTRLSGHNYQLNAVAGSHARSSALAPLINSGLLPT